MEPQMEYMLENTAPGGRLRRYYCCTALSTAIRPSPFKPAVRFSDDFPMLLERRKIFYRNSC